MCLSHLLIALACSDPMLCVCGVANWSKFQAQPWAPPCKAVALNIGSILKKRVPNTMQDSGSRRPLVAAVDHSSRSSFSILSARKPKPGCSQLMEGRGEKRGMWKSGEQTEARGAGRKAVEHQV